MTEPVRVGVVGCGLIARREHLPSYTSNPDAELVGVTSGRRETAEAAAREFGARRVYDTFDELLADPEVEAVDLCTPNALHAPMAIAAARAGKHVLVEKPMALTLTEADAMIGAARESGVLLMVAHNLRYVPVYEQIKRIVAEGVIGRPFSARGSFMHAGPDEFWGADSEWFWDAAQAGGGSLFDMGIHMIDLLRWFIGRPVTEVTAMTARVFKPTPFDDNAMVTMRFEGDVLAAMQSSWSARPFPDRHVLIHGELGHVHMGRSTAEPLVVNLKGEDGDRVIPWEIPKRDAPYNPFVEFIRCIRTGDTPRTSAEEGRATLAVTLAAYESAQTRQVVRVGE